MKKIKLNLLTLGVASIILSSCGGLNKMVENSKTVKYEVIPSPLETNGGEVAVTIKTTFPEKYFNKSAVVTATPILKYEGGQVEFEPTVLQGEKVKANNKVIAYSGGNYSFTGKVPYKPEMLKSELVVDMSARIKEKTPVAIPGVKIADGVIATSTLVKIDPKAVLVGDKYQRVTSDSYNAEILYLINQADVRNSELKKGEVKKFEDNLTAASKQTDKVAIKGAKISAYASPDGPMTLNEKLSDKRGGTAEKYLITELKKLKVQGYDVQGFLNKMVTAEDWDGFKKLMEASSIQDKELVLRVLSMYSDPAVREKEIKNISEAFNEIKTKVLPQLRRSQMFVNIDNIGYSDDQIKALAQSKPDTLKLEEILYAAALTNDLNEKARIYTVASKNFPSEFRPKNNLGYVYLLMGKTADAKAAFEAAKAIENNDVVKNNLGAIALMDGDLATAEGLFTSAMGAGEVVNYNLGIIKIKKADYAAAVNYFGNKASFNAALAQLLNKETDKSISTLGELGESKDAMVYYLKAVAGARAGKEDMVLNNLRTAVGLDASLKAYAKKDAEFLKYAANEGFTAIVQ
jgi:tetratricopeptide (TPR) repeat protein